MTDPFTIPNHDGVLESPVRAHYDAEDERDRWYGDFWMHRAQPIERAIREQLRMSDKRVQEIMEQMCELYADQKEGERGQ